MAEYPRDVAAPVIPNLQGIRIFILLQVPADIPAALAPVILNHDNTYPGAAGNWQRVFDVTISSIDFYPTILNLTGMSDDPHSGKMASSSPGYSNPRIKPITLA
jgi:hypothetical protein